MASVESSAKTKNKRSYSPKTSKSPVIRFLVVFSALVFQQAAWGYELPSSVSLSQTFDNDQNRQSAIDLTLGTPFFAMVHLGLSRSSLQFDDDVKGENKNYYFGISSNPLKDWVLSYDFAYMDVSDQMTILDPSVSVQRYFEKIQFKLSIGYRTIKTEVTPLLAFFNPSFGSELLDENFWWRLSTKINVTPDFVVGLSYNQYQYSRRFDFFNFTNLADAYGYNFDTINYGASFADYIYSINGSYYKDRWDFSLDYTFVSNEFDDSKTYTWTPSIGYLINKSWYVNMNLGLSRGVTPEEETDVTGGFLGLGATYSF